MKNYLLSIVCVSSALMFAACSQDAIQSQPEDSPKDVKNLSELDKTTWEPVFVDGLNGVKAPGKDSPDAPFLHFGENGKVNGYSGCNSFFGAISKLDANGTKYDFSKLASTRRMGPYADYEFVFLKALSSSDEIKANSDTLVLSKGGKTTIEFKKLQPMQKANKAKNELSFKERQLLQDANPKAKK